MLSSAAVHVEGITACYTDDIAATTATVYLVGDCVGDGPTFVGVLALDARTTSSTWPGPWPAIRPVWTPGMTRRRPRTATTSSSAPWSRAGSVDVPGVSLTTPVAVDGNTLIMVGETPSSDASSVLVKIAVDSGRVLSVTKQHTMADSDTALPNAVAFDACQFVYADGRAYGLSMSGVDPREPSAKPELFTVG